ncbi:hypothetical protein [Pseudomonas saudiphocaensis]|uniref:hypothetical protein n=1 Tax=Pseudomonas saudiphocaensis TaxID=1499686 RepID=UPI000F7B3BE8|nr:hypothetical protein [Pseudomonas saudiphocaensis]MBE7927387.1 hypothetical protein [Pseudomonas saudiphocaensis]RRV15583.1 hypothetical protein EGJ00_11315 [Pseudomonas saudiphocaensis]
MRSDPLDRLHSQQPEPGEEEPPIQAPDPDFITDNPDVQDPDGPADRPGIGPDIQDPGRPDINDPNEPGLGNPIP